MVSIAQAARSTGVPAATLRVWERRYGVPCPERTASGYRDYRPQDLAQIARMRDLVADGLGAAAAATLVAGGSAPADPRRFVARLVDPSAPDALDLDHELAVGLRSVDLAEQSDQWLLPMLAEVGRRWAAGELAIGTEHALSAALARRLSVIWHELPEGTRTPTVLVGLPGGARHDITLFCFAVLLRREGYRVGYLGADLPTDAWGEAVASSLPCVVVTATATVGDVAAVEELVRVVRAAGAGLVAVGGGHQDKVGEPVVRLGHAFGPALRRFSTLV